MGGRQSIPKVITSVQPNQKNAGLRRTNRLPRPNIIPKRTYGLPRSNITQPTITIDPRSNNITQPTITNISSNSLISPKFTKYNISLPSIEWQGPICIGTVEGQRGFRQHMGECLNDSVQMLLLSADGIKENFQRLLFEKPIIREEIETRINELKPNTSSQTVNYIYEYMKLFQRRFRRHYAGHISGKSLGSGKGQNAIPCSLYGTYIVKDLFDEGGIGLGAIESLTKEKYKEILPANTMSLLFFLINFYKLSNVPLIELDHEPNGRDVFNIFGYFRDTKNITGLLFMSDLHATAMYKCNGIEYFYDDNSGVSKFPISKYFDINSYIKNEYSYFDIGIRDIAFCLLTMTINNEKNIFWPGVQYLNKFYIFHPNTLNLVVIEYLDKPIMIDNMIIEVLKRDFIHSIVPITSKTLKGGGRRRSRKTRRPNSID